jgi:hypothetical protein
MPLNRRDHGFATAHKNQRRRSPSPSRPAKVTVASQGLPGLNLASAGKPRGLRLLAALMGHPRKRSGSGPAANGGAVSIRSRLSCSSLPRSL